jgi:cell division protein ZapA (FtsZ GTPase activity inhibitor)
MEIETWRGIVFGTIGFLTLLLLVLLGIYMRNEYRAMKKRHADEERRIAEREAELKAHLHQKPENRP